MLVALVAAALLTQAPGNQATCRDSAGAAVSVRVVGDSTGTPVAGASVGLWRADCWAHTDSAGRATLIGVRPGHTRFVLAASGYEFVQPLLHVHLPTTDTTLRIRVYDPRRHATCGDSAGAVTSVRVVDDSTGQPIPDASLGGWRIDCWTHTDSTGQATLTGVRPGRARFNLAAIGYEPSQPVLTVHLPSTDTVVRMRRPDPLRRCHEQRGCASLIDAPLLTQLGDTVALAEAAIRVGLAVYDHAALNRSALCVDAPRPAVLTALRRHFARVLPKDRCVARAYGPSWGYVDRRTGHRAWSVSLLGLDLGLGKATTVVEIEVGQLNMQQYTCSFDRQGAVWQLKSCALTLES